MAHFRLCSIENCGKPVRARGWCENHYRTNLRWGDPLQADKRFRPSRTCSMEGCGKSANWRDGGKRGWCDAHYQRWYTHGDPLICLAAANGELEKWLRCHVSFDGDLCLVWPFGRGPHGYSGQAYVNGLVDYAHRHMCRLVNGRPPTSVHQAAHSCGRGHLGCVHPKHLRWATPKENQADRLLHGTR